MFQETHLTVAQEYAFKLFAPTYDWFFSHGTSNSAGICIGIKQKLRVISNKVGKINRRLLAVDLKGHSNYRLVTVYAPTDPKERKLFFQEMVSFLDENTVLAGDFNSVVNDQDRLSGNLDATSGLLEDIIQTHHLSEPSGPHLKTFSYHHPSNHTRKSRIDQIYMNLPHDLVRRYTLPSGISDHYMVGTISLPDNTYGPKQWCFPIDLLGNK